MNAIVQAGINSSILEISLIRITGQTPEYVKTCNE